MKNSQVVRVSRIKDMRKIAHTGTFEYLCSMYEITRANYKEFLHRSDQAPSR